MLHQFVHFTPVINGNFEGVRHHGEGYGFAEIGADLQRSAHEAYLDSDRLVSAVSASTEPPLNTDIGVSDAATAAAISVKVEEGHVAAATGLLPDASNPNGDITAPASSKDINSLYDKAFQSMHKSIFLLTQWKASWDAAIAAACAQETVGDDHGLADAVASAAAVAAAASEANPNMASLLLAADQKKGDDKATSAAVEAASKVESFEV